VIVGPLAAGIAGVDAAAAAAAGLAVAYQKIH
jgi:hypothetical protein